MPRLAAPSVKRSASRLANVLDDAHIPYFMWGWTALGLMGQDWGFPEIDFVVPDTMIKDAAHALARAGNLICNDPGCPQGRQDRATSRALVIARDRFHMLPEKHFHLVGGNVLLLHRKSNIAWWLPDLQAGPPAADDPHFILSTDEERLPPRAVDGPSGPWTQYYPVKIMIPGSFTESIMMCGCRDYNHPTGFDSLWRFMLLYLLEEHSCEKPVRSEFRTLWNHYNQEVEEAFRDLRDRLAAENRLPPRV
jgi:hypothetical protein